MPLAPYEGSMLVPGMGTPVFTTEHDNSGIFYGSPHSALYLTHAVVDGASRDDGNTDMETTLRIGLVMAQVAATQKWVPFDAAGAGGAEVPAGILLSLGLNTQYGGADTDRYLATILVGGVINPEAICTAAAEAYGIGKVDAGHLIVRKAFLYAFKLSDDFMAFTSAPLVGR